jgi:O-antigen/teichoic acid export membrane protein
MINAVINYLIFSALSSGVSFLIVIYMTRHISVEDFGVVGLFMSILYILPQFISFSSIGLVSINKVKLSNEKFLEFSKTHLTFSILIFISVFFISIIIGIIVKEYIILFLVIPIISFVQNLTMFHNAELVQDGQSKRFGIYRLILSIISLLFTVVAISYYNLNWDGRLYAILFSELLLLLITIKYSYTTLRNFVYKVDISKFKEYIYFGSPLIFGLSAGWVLNQADRFIVLSFFSLKDVGIYTLAYSIGIIINVINQAVTNAIVPQLYKSLEKKDGHKLVKKLNVYYSLTMLSLALIVGLSSFWYVPLLFGQDYAQSPMIILFIALAFAFNGVYRVTGCVIEFYKRNVLKMKLLHISAILNVILSIALIPFFGIISPAIATFFAYILLAYLSYAYGWKILKKEELF